MGNAHEISVQNSCEMRYRGMLYSHYESMNFQSLFYLMLLLNCFIRRGIQNCEKKLLQTNNGKIKLLFEIQLPIKNI